MSAQLTTAQFDEAAAQSYLPHYVVKQAKLMDVADGIESTIHAEWGSTQTFVGPWYAVYNASDEVIYGVARQEFDETHAVAPEVENGYYKNTAIEAYKHGGDPIKVVTVMASGVIETENTATDGDWIVRWPHGEVGVMTDEKFRKLYNVG